ncbi:hypothetical protein [Xanthobacter autotrophicus]|uniref:hypothetical protein n=1 Tax=Xanthobacter autotrophicus TaxID=280 RepID=UPI0024A6D078|nr:hypothetical protein [Xanthobacter autotrophicus]MDI4657562.1 hypothetical protein [Xanthobacter autotrophicus]
MKAITLKCLVRSTLCALVVGIASPALALDPQPKGYREKQRHVFRDVQLGLSHPVPHGRGTPASQMQANDQPSSHRAQSRHDAGDMRVAHGRPESQGSNTSATQAQAAVEQSTASPVTQAVR